MRQSENDLISGSSLREELVDVMTDTITDVVARLCPTTRLRLLAFMHLFDKPEQLKASFGIDDTGMLRLTLALKTGGTDAGKAKSA